MKKFIRFIPCICTLAVMTVIFIFSSENAEESTRSSTGFIKFIAGIFNALFNTEKDLLISKSIEHYVRKTAHFAIYALLGFNAYWMFLWNYSVQKKHYILVFSTLLSFIYACSDELHQAFSPGRSASFGDVILDTAGALCGGILLLVITHIYTYSKEKKVTR